MLQEISGPRFFTEARLGLSAFFVQTKNFASSSPSSSILRVRLSRR